MAQNVEHWLLDLRNFQWARERITLDKWYQIRKYFPGEKLRKGMRYLDAETGEVVDSSQHTYVPAGRVFLYGYDLRNFAGIEMPDQGPETGPQRHPTLSQRPAPGTPQDGNG